MKRATTMLGALAVAAAGFLFAAPAAHAHGGLMGSLTYGTSPNQVTCNAYSSFAHTYPGDFTNSPTNTHTHFWLCGDEQSYSSRYGLINNLPSHLKTQLDTRDVNFFFFKNYDEAKIWLEANYSSFTLPTTAKNGALGYSSKDKKFSIVYEQHYDTSGTLQTSSSSQINGSAKHEAGHQADYANSDLSKSAYFHDLMEQDIAHYNSAYNFCTQLYPSLCYWDSGTNQWVRYPQYIGKTNYEILEDATVGFPSYFAPGSVNEWKEVFAEEFARQSGNGTNAAIDGFLSKFYCTMEYLDTYHASGTGTAPTWTGSSSYCTNPSASLP